MHLHLLSARNSQAIIKQNRRDNGVTVHRLSSSLARHETRCPHEMLTTRRPALLALGTLSVSRTPQKQSQQTMVKATRTIWVKGDPQKQVLGDCPFCHRALLTLELKVHLNPHTVTTDCLWTSVHNDAAS